MHIYQLFKIATVQDQQLSETLHQATVCTSLADVSYLRSLLDVDLECANAVFQRCANNMLTNHDK